MKFRWLKFVLAFTPVILVIALLTVYGPRIMPRYLASALGALLFFFLFLSFYRSPRFHMSSRPITLSRARLSLSLVLFVIAIVSIEWLGPGFPHILPWLTPLMMGGLLTWYFFRGRKDTW